MIRDCKNCINKDKLKKMGRQLTSEICDRCWDLSDDGTKSCCLYCGEETQFPIEECNKCKEMFKQYDRDCKAGVYDKETEETEIPF